MTKIINGEWNIGSNTAPRNTVVRMPTSPTKVRPKPAGKKAIAQPRRKKTVAEAIDMLNDMVNPPRKTSGSVKKPTKSVKPSVKTAPKPAKTDGQRIPITDTQTRPRKTVKPAGKSAVKPTIKKGKQTKLSNFKDEPDLSKTRPTEVNKKGVTNSALLSPLPRAKPKAPPKPRDTSYAHFDTMKIEGDLVSEDGSALYPMTIKEAMKMHHEGITKKYDR